MEQGTEVTLVGCQLLPSWNRELTVGKIGGMPGTPFLDQRTEVTGERMGRGRNKGVTNEIDGR